MKLIEKAVFEYNKKLSFFRRKKRITLEKGDYLFGEYGDSEKPFILNNYVLNTHALTFGSKNRIESLYFNYIIQKIESNEPFIYINNFENSNLNDNDISSIIEHAKKYNYSYKIEINNYLDYFSINDIKEKSYIFNIYRNDFSYLETLDHISLIYDIHDINNIYDLLINKIVDTFSSNTPIGPLMSIILANYIPYQHLIFSQGRSRAYNFLISISSEMKIDFDKINQISANTTTKFLFTQNCSIKDINFIAKLIPVENNNIIEGNYVYSYNTITKIK